MVGVKQPIAGVVYPPTEVLKKYIDDGVLREETVVDALNKTFRQHPKRPALVGPFGQLSYGDLDEQSTRLAAALLDMGLAPRDRALFQMANCPELVIALIACLKAGIIPVCTVAAHRQAEIGAIGGHAGARAHFVQGDHKNDLVALARTMRNKIESMEYTVVCRGAAPAGTQGMDSLIAGQTLSAAKTTVRAVELDPYQVAFFQLSGGSTSTPKIIPRFHNEYLHNFEAMIDKVGFLPDDCLFTASPLVHNAGMVLILGPALILGCRLAMTLDTSAEALIEIMREHKPNWFPMRGPLIERLRPYVEKNPDDFKHIKGIVSTNAGGLTEKVFGAPAVQYFGMTEGLITLTPPSSSQDIRHNSIGLPVSAGDEIRLFEPGTEKEVPLGQPGELVVRGPYTTHGYFNMPEVNKTAVTSEGFFRSGDLVCAFNTDAGICYRYESRLKDVIDRAGEKFYCAEVEGAIKKHESILDVAVVPMPDPHYGERACAFIVLEEGATAPDLKQLGTHLNLLGLAKYKWPERIEILAQLPVSAVGKLQKQPLVALASEYRVTT